jgi:hypothetical protein
VAGHIWPTHHIFPSLELYQSPYVTDEKNKAPKKPKYICKSIVFRLIGFHIKKENEATGKTGTFTHFFLLTLFTAWKNHTLSINSDFLGHNK